MLRQGDGRTSIDAIRRYYREYEEWKRLDTAAGRLEFDRALQLLDAHLSPDSRILDLGGGPGRYTIELARRGHRVTLVDLSENHVRQAHERIREAGCEGSVDGIWLGDARELDFFDDEAFDAVVAFGPFYHLLEEDERQAAASELARVLRPRGDAFVQFMPRLSAFPRLVRLAASHPERVDEACIRQVRDSGRLTNPSDEGFQEGGFIAPEAIRELFEGVGLELKDALSLRGLAAGHEEELMDVRDDEPEVYDALMDWLEATCRRPEVVATGQVAVAVVTKR